MAYVAVRGGRAAIENAEKLFHLRRGGERGGDPVEVEQVMEQLHLAVDRVMGEGSLYAPRLAALAMKQAAGDTLEAAFLVRAYRSTLARIGYSLPADTGAMRVERRISAAFKNVPGGQLLGPTPDYTLRLLNFALFSETAEGFHHHTRQLLEQATGIDTLPDSFPKVVDLLRRENLLVDRVACGTETDDADSDPDPLDVTREALSFPAPRSAALQTLARGETGGLLALAYSNMRGYGTVHPTVGELRVGTVDLTLPHPWNGATEKIGEVRVTEAEIIAHAEQEGRPPRFTLGYGLCFGHNETKAIAMAVLDRAMQAEEARTPSEDQEFVLQHVDGIESMGFCNHYKLPHYVTFQSALDRLRKAREEHAAETVV
jgi:alpha-D-ribose 1-methylphosphonate 5-triphosphate synthase subunit PhnI